MVTVALCMQFGKEGVLVHTIGLKCTFVLGILLDKSHAECRVCSRLVTVSLIPFSSSPLSQEVEVLRVKASRVDKLQVELNSLREKLEDSSRHQAKLKVVPSSPSLYWLSLLNEGVLG